ncbi:ribonuclease E/G [Limibacillus halophilus]|uniref:Ribonuclease G/E n=1 Tax=Limibacillus halophilus TaxID=1579333 RepID=A0A839SWK6_9PROT|nr:ribonuclease E/G [Limibacillus halophilus]MBB3066882.1 Ribonuclease G/E [Limibacillus halophilus]
MSRVLISSLPGEVRMARCVDDRLTDLLIEYASNPSRLGNVYRARVTKRDRGLAAAFCDIGEEVSAFLPLEKDAALSEGDGVILRIVREAEGEKGPKAALYSEALPEGLSAQSAPCLLLRAADPVLALLQSAEAPDEIVVDDPAFHQRLRRLLTDRRPDLVAALTLYHGNAALFEAEALEEEVEALLRPEVRLPSGARLWIEPTHACVAIDLDSARQKSARAANREAAWEIARQVRLRNLSGLILIDFLDLQQRSAREELEGVLAQAFAEDPEPVQFHSVRASGLFTMTRRRSRLALHELVTAPCGTQGSGREYTPLSQAYRALRALQTAALDRPGDTAGLRVTPQVKQALEVEAAEALQSTNRRIGYEVMITPDKNSTGFDVTWEADR